MTKEKTQSKDSIYNEEINNLKEDKNKLNDELEKMKNEMGGLRDENKKLEEEIKLMKNIKNDIETYKKDNEMTIQMLKSTNESLEKRNDEYSNKLKEIEVSLSSFKIESKMKEDEMYSTLNTFKSMIEKNKKNFEIYYKKLPEDVKNEINALNKKHKFIK